MLNARHAIRPLVFIFTLFVLAAGSLTVAQAQNFTLTPSQLSPRAGIDPGGTATATVALATTTGFASPVTLTCTATSSELSNLPVCTPSPTVATPDATVSLTITTSGDTAFGQYTITVSGTSGSETETSTPLYLEVVAVPQDYTLSVTQTVSPTTVTAGGAAKATITITPIAGYTGDVTLSCLSITPTVTASPICFFDAVSGGGPTVNVTNGTAATSVLTISTYGTTQNTAKLWTPRIFYAFWLAVPGLALAGIGSRGSRRNKWAGIFLLLLVAGSLFALPSCSSNNSSSTTSNNANGFVTPKNTYTITLTGVDANGVGPSNNSTSTTGTTPGAATVSLTVN